MGRKGKKYLEASEKYDKNSPVSLEEAVRILKSFPARKMDETVELNFHLGIDGRQADQALRGTVMLPCGTGKDVCIVAITQGELVAEAEEAGADHVGSAELIARIEKGWLDFDLVVASPDMMGQIGKLGRVLGPRGLMPNPKTGTVTRDVGQAVREAKAGRIEFRADNKSGNNAQGPIGKVSFDEEALVENAKAFTGAILRAKPAASKGQFVRRLILSSTMGPGIRIDPSALAA